MKKVSFFIVLFTYFSFISANGNAPGNCLKNGTISWGGSGTSVYAPLCKSGYGRPGGVCNCVVSLNSCNQLLAGCPASRTAKFTTTLPSVIYVGQYYEFKTDIRVIGALPCLSRNLPAGLTLTVLPDEEGFNVTTISGTPTESVPMADYGLAVGPRGVGSESLFFSFEVQACSEDDVSIPTSSPTVAATKAPSSSPTSAPASSPILPCSTAQQGFMRCTGSSQYTTCNHGTWGPVQSCQSGLACYAGGNYIYCDAPGRNL